MLYPTPMRRRRITKPRTPPTPTRIRRTRTAIVKADRGRVKRKKVDATTLLKNKILNQVNSGDSITKSLRDNNTKYQRYYQWVNKDVEFKRKLTLAKEGRCSVLHEKFYEQNVKPMAEHDFQNMDEFDLDLHSKRASVIAKSQGILTAFKKEDAPHLYNKDLNKLNVETMNNMSFNINLDQLKKVVGAFKPQVIEGEIVPSKIRHED